MSKNYPTNQIKIKNCQPDKDILIESNDYLGFIVGYTSNGFAYGLTHEQCDAKNTDTLDDIYY